jgi:hypothetical protein
MPDVSLSWYLALSAVLFTIGVAGVIIKRNAIAMFMCIELMLNGRDRPRQGDEVHLHSRAVHRHRRRADVDHRVSVRA